MKDFKRAFIPNKSVEKSTSTMIVAFWVIATFVIWNFSSSTIIPKPTEVLVAISDLFTKQNFLQELTTSTWLCIKSILYASLISLVIAYASVLSFFRPLATFVAKTRFLTTVGLTFIFAQMTPDVSYQKVAILVFGITVFLVTSFLSIIMSTTKDELDYARTLRMNSWEAVWNVIVLAKADQVFEAIKQNFAISWMMLVMVENLARSEGGIGVILYNQNKHFHIDSIYAVQIIVLMLGLFFDWTLGKIKVLLFPYSVLTLERK